MTHVLRLLPATALLLGLAACDTTPDDTAGEGELITAVTLTLTPSGGGTPVTATFRDTNGDGLVQSTEVGTVRLLAGATYTGALTLAGPDGDLTAEVQGEADAHQVVYTVGGGAASRVTITITDRDGAEKPLGLATTMAASSGSLVSGTLRVVLYHYEDTSRKVAGIAGSEADVDLTFPLVVTVAP